MYYIVFTLVLCKVTCYPHFRPPGGGPSEKKTFQIFPIQTAVSGNRFRTEDYTAGCILAVGYCRGYSGYDQHSQIDGLWFWRCNRIVRHKRVFFVCLLEMLQIPYFYRIAVHFVSRRSCCSRTACIPGLVALPCLLHIASESMHTAERLFSARFGLQQRTPAQFHWRRACLCFSFLILPALFEQQLLPEWVEILIK